jgi:hypothetical protein
MQPVAFAEILAAQTLEMGAGIPRPPGLTAALDGAEVSPRRHSLPGAFSLAGAAAGLRAARVQCPRTGRSRARGPAPREKEMSATTTDTPRRRRPPPVSVRAYFVGGATRQDVIDGSAVLSVTDLGTGAEAAYWCLAVFAGGRCTGFRLTKLGTGEVYDLPRDLSGCSCPDRKYKPGRPGGCRHMAALRQALPALGRPRPAPG